MKSIWREAYGFPLYEINIFGQVRNKVTKRMIKPYNGHQNAKQGKVFMSVSLQKNGRGYTKGLARLMLKTFQYTTKRNQYALHYDMDGTNNANDNLGWSSLGDLHRYKRSGKLKGIYSWSIGKKSFRAILKMGSKIRTLGYYRTKREAAEVYYGAFLSKFGYEPFPAKIIGEL